jgi:hypothetical protein
VLIDHHFIPCVFALLPCKTEYVYTRLFAAVQNILSQNGNIWMPERIMMDFEAAAILAVRRIFTTTLISGCNFHYGQAIHRYMRTNLPNIPHQFTNNEEMKMAIKSLHALSFVPISWCIPISRLLWPSFQIIKKREVFLFFLKLRNL